MNQSDIEVLEIDGVTIAVLGIEYDNLNEEQLTAASDKLLSLAKTIDPPHLVFDLSRTRFFCIGISRRHFPRLEPTHTARWSRRDVLCFRSLRRRPQSHQCREAVGHLRDSARSSRGSYKSDLGKLNCPSSNIPARKSASGDRDTVQNLCTKVFFCVS